MPKSTNKENQAGGRAADYGRLAMISADEEFLARGGGGGGVLASGNRKNNDKNRCVTSCRESLQVCVSASPCWKKRRRNPETGLFLFLILLSSFILLSVLILGVVIYLNYLGFGRHRNTTGHADPCREKACHFGAECRPSKEGRLADCVCPERCATYGDSKGSRPVCGSDGQDYPNICELRRNACKEMKDIRVKFEGRCDPCDGIQCPASQVCQLDDNRNPICRCNAICSAEVKPVCGSDGKTYSNECALRVEACKSRRSLRIIYSGDCASAFRLLSKGGNPCENSDCSPSHECDIDRYGSPTCLCPPPCEPVMRPVCGSNGLTYDSECELRRFSCIKKASITVAFRGACGEEGPCVGKECDYGAVCVVSRGQAVCECPSCSEEFLPVCGSDGVSYTNECKLRRESCLTAKEITVKSEGLCSGCGSKHCDYYAICETAEGTLAEEKAKCVCPTSCDKHEAPVCGSDAITYPNECSLKVAACKRQVNIIVASQGPCDLCQNVHCKYKARCENGRCVCPKECPETYEPVCASDGSTYANECEMRKASCLKNDEFSALFYGECEEVPGLPIGPGSRSCKDAICRFGGVCDMDSEGGSHCVCHFQCERLTDPVCGSDGRLYSNECKLQEESCKQQKMIRIVQIDRCDKLKVTPCDGDRPLRDPVTGKEYFCGDGPKSQPCPMDSYCHKSSSFAKCCREDGNRGVEARECLESEFGCCPDGFTAALGPTNAGCPSDCLCNRLGSVAETCHPTTKQCHCKTGVGGLRCDRCEPGYWGLHKIADGNNGCSPCACNKQGSVRDDCEQMTGRCVCRHGIQGMKCDICPAGTVLTNDGCTDASIAYPVPGTCSQLRCRFGAICQERGHGKSQCVCDIRCNPEPKNPVCGSDGVAYTSECQLRIFSCRYQKQINIRAFGLCKIDGVEPTVGPVRRSTIQKSTSEQYESRSTRDITFGLSEGLFLSTGPTTARPSIDALQFETPGFSGRSYLELQRLHAYTRLSLELEFKSYTNDGILLYNGQTQSGIGDFVSLAIKNGYVEFRYNLGSGPVVLRSPHRLQTGRFHKLVAKRYLRDGTLTLDGKIDVSGRSEGVLKSLDLGQNLFLGYVPIESKTIFENIGTKNGLVGCIRRLRIGSKDMKLSLPESKDIIGAEKIRECEDSPCTSVPCMNGGSCVDTQDSYKCLCHLGYTGNQCEIQKDPCASNPCAKGSKCTSRKDGSYDCGCSKGPQGKICDHHHREFQEVFTPYFDGQAYLKLPTLQNVGQSFGIEIWFLAHSKNGMLMYNGQLASGRGDFISVNLVDGFVQFRYDLGSGIANLSGLVVLTSPSPVTLEEWHTVLVTRLSRKGTLQVNDGPVVTGESKTPLSELNLDQPLYLGGYKHLSMVNPHSGIITGLSGALQRLIVNGDIWDALRSRAHEVHQLGKFTGPPCGERPCLNDGVCVPELNEYYCRCPLNYSGLKCEKYIQNGGRDYSISLDGATKLSFSMKEKDRDAQSTNRFDIRFRTTSSNGLLLWTHKGTTVRADYLSLAINGGYVELSLNLGKQRDLLVIRNPVKIDDGLWHVVSIHRNKRIATLQVDNSPPVGKMSEPGATELNTDGILWIGGNSNLPPGLPKPYYDLFRGCLHSILMEGEPVNLTQYVTSTNAQPCTES